MNPRTQLLTKIVLRSFEPFSHNLTNKNIFHRIQEWLASLNISTSSRRTYLHVIKGYLYYNGFRLTNQDFKHNIKLPKPIKEERYPLSLAEIRRIFEVASYGKKTLFLGQLSSGMRLGEIVQLKKKHLDFTKKRVMVKIPSSIAKFGRARTTFFSSEVKLNLKELDDNDLVFGTNPNAIHAEISEETTLRKYLTKTGLNQKYESTNRYKINTHSFRAYFITKLSRYDPNFAKLLAGQEQSNNLLQYDRLTDDEKLDLYLKFEPELLIFNNTKLEIQNQDILTRLEVAEQAIKEYEKYFKVITFDQMADHLHDVRKA